MCTFFAVSRAAYYAWLKRSQQPDKDSARLQAVQQAWEKSHRTYGYRRVALWLRQHKGLVINHKAVLRLMNKLNIRSIARQRHPYKQRARLDFHQRYANLSKCSAHTDPVSRPSSFVTGRSVLGFTVWPEISQQTNPIRNGLLIHLRRTQYRCHLHRYPTRLGVSGHHQGPVRRFHRCTSSGKTPRPVPIPMQPSAERTVSVCASQRGVRTSLCDAAQCRMHCVGIARDKCGTVRDWAILCA